MSGMNPNILIVLHSPGLHLWQFEVIESMAQNPQLKLHLLISPAPDLKSNSPSGFTLYSKLDEKFFSKKLPQENAKGVKTLQELSQSVLLYDTVHDLPIAFDLAISLESNGFPFEKYGIIANEYWFSELSQGAELPGFDEIYYSLPSLTLRILSSKIPTLFEPTILYGSTTAINAFSYYGTMNPCLWKLRYAFNRLLEDYLQGFQHLKKSNKTHAETIAVKSFDFEKQDLSGIKFLFFVAKIFYRFFVHKSRNFICREQFILAYRKRGNTLLSQGNLEGFKLLEPPSSEFWADPFLFTHKNKTYLFFENLEFSTGVGKLSVLNLSALEAGHAAVPADVLVMPYHLSYPQVFKDQEQIYMLPETTGNNAVELYVAEEFPLKWKKAGNLLDNIKAHDATLMKKDGLYWLFANVESKNAPFNDELFIFSADSLKGEWRAHPLNPVATHVESARSGGRIHYDGEKLLRPSQDCSVCYGYGLNFNEVIVLNQKDYSEALLEKITPFQQKDYHAIHSYDVNDEYEVIDMARYMPKFSIIRLFSSFSPIFTFQFSFHFKAQKNKAHSVVLNF